LGYDRGVHALGSERNALKFPDAWWSPAVINLLGGFAMRTQIHHVAGIGMVVLGIYHVVYHILLIKNHCLKEKYGRL